MPQPLSENFEAFQALFPEISEAEIPKAFENLRLYAQLVAEVAGSTSPALTENSPGGTVPVGEVDPRRTFTNTG
jgi:hypothetical protein